MAKHRLDRTGRGGGTLKQFLLLFSLSLFAFRAEGQIQEPTHALGRRSEGPLIHTISILTIVGAQTYGSLSPNGEPQQPLFSWDREWVGTYSHSADRLSDQLPWVGLTVPLLWAGEWAAERIGAGEFGTDLLIVTEAALLDGALNKWVRGVSKLWARPLVFSDQSPEEERHSAQARSSFYSGHTSTAFAMATAVVSIQSHREDPLIGAVPLAVALYGTAASIGVLRVQAGKHYPTDVVAGAAIGTLIGWGVAHLRQVPSKGELPTGFSRLIRTKQLKVIPYPYGLTLAWRIGGPARHELKY